jgi:hypothetical protein
MFKKYFNATNVNKINSFRQKYFTIKFHNSDTLLRNFKENINVPFVSEKIKFMITQFEKKNTVPRWEMKYFLQNSKFYKIKNIDELKVLIKMYLYISKSYHFDYEIKHKISLENNIDKKENITIRSQLIIYNNLKTILSDFVNLNENNLTINQLEKIIKDVNTFKHNKSKEIFHTIFSEIIKVFLENQLLKNNKPEFWESYLKLHANDFLNIINNSAQCRLILENFFNDLIGKTIPNINLHLSPISNFIFKLKISKNTYVKLSQQIIDDKDKTNLSPSNSNSNDVYISMVQKLFDNSTKSSDILLNSMTEVDLISVDKNISLYLNDIYFYSHFNLEEKISNINKIYEIINKSEKHNIQQIKYLKNFIEITNKIFADLLDKNKATFSPITKFYMLNYKHIKTYFYTEHSDLIKIFQNTHMNVFNYLSNFQQKILIDNISHYNNQDIEYIFELTKILYLNNFNYEQYFKKFVEKNFNYLFEKNKQNYTILYKMILTCRGLKTLPESFSDILINAYLNLDNKIDHKYYIFNLHSILYNCLVSEYQNSDIILKIAISLINRFIMFSPNNQNSLRRFIQIVEFLKIYKNGEIYLNEIVNNKIKRIEELCSQLDFDNSDDMNLWWDKDRFSANKYTVECILKCLKSTISKEYNVKIPSWKIKGIYSSDCAIVHLDKDIMHIEFVGPYNLVHHQDLSIFEPNKKHVIKSKFFKKEYIKLDEISFINILKSNDLTKIFSTLINK